MKQGLKIDVLTAARQRISYTFDNFERIYVSFSGGMGMNGFTNFFETVIDGVLISWISREDDEIRIHSLIDPERDGAAMVTQNGFTFMDEDDETGPLPEGLIVFGTHKWNRFTIEEVLSEYPEYRQIMEKLQNKIIASKAAEAVVPGVVEKSANEAESELSSMAAALGRKGGQTVTPKTQSASRENGKKGGRPKKIKEQIINEKENN